MTDAEKAREWLDDNYPTLGRHLADDVMEAIEAYAAHVTALSAN